MPSVARRVDELDWSAISGVLDDVGCSLTGPVLSPPECHELTGLYSDDGRFRSTIDMARHRFGQGQYRYFDRPLPELVAELRAAFWPHLVVIAREWAGRLAQPLSQLGDSLGTQGAYLVRGLAELSGDFVGFKLFQVPQHQAQPHTFG